MTIARVAIAGHLKGTRIHRREDLHVARAAIRQRAAARAAALAPLLRELRDAGKSVNAIAAELTRRDIEAPRCGARWAWKSVHNLFVLAGEPPPPTQRTRLSPIDNVEPQTRESA